jgi:hypothetical protein
LEDEQPSRSSIITKKGEKMSTYTATTVPTQFVEANGIRFAYRRWGKRSGLPLVFNQHFTGNLDNWDPTVLDGLAKEREVIIFNNAGVASSTGEVPTTFVGMAKNAEAFINGLGLTKVDLATNDDEGLADARAADPFALPRNHPGSGRRWGPPHRVRSNNNPLNAADRFGLRTFIGR